MAALLAVGTTRGKVSLYDTASGKERTFVAGGEAISGLSFAPDSQTLAIVHADSKARLRAIRDGKLLATFALKKSDFQQCLLGPRGKTLLFLGQPDQNQVSLYRTGQAEPVVRGLTTSLGGFACSPDGQRFTAADSIEIKLWDAASGKLVSRIPSPAGGVYVMAFSPDGTRLGMGGQEGMVTVWDLTTNQRLLQLKGHLARVSRLRFSDDGKALVSGADDGTAKLWEFSDLEEGQSLVPANGNPAPWLAYSLDGRWLAVAGRPTQLWDARTGLPARRFDPSVRLAFSPDSKTLALGDMQGCVHLCDVVSGKVRRTLAGRPGEANENKKAVGSLAFSPNGKLLAAGFGWAQWWDSDYEQVARVWEVESGQELQALAHQNSVPALAFSPRGNLLATVGREGVLRLWNVDTWHPERTVAGPPGQKPSDSVAFSPNGDMLATGDKDHVIRLRETTSGRLLRSLQGHSYGVFALSFSRDGKTLASASWDRTVKLWDVVSGRDLRTFVGHTNWVQCVAFSPDGSVLASCDQSGGVRLWDTLSRWHRAAQVNKLASEKRQ